MGKIDILMINMSNYAEWQRGVSNRNYHVLQELLAHERVDKILAVDYPPLTFKRAMRNYKDGVMIPLHEGTVVKRSVYDRLTRLNDRLHVYANVNFFRKPKKFVEQLQLTMKNIGFGDFVAWSFFPPIMSSIKDIGQKLTIFDTVDNWVEHPSYSPFKTRIRSEYQFIQKNTDIIFTVSQPLISLFENQPNVYWVPNGVDVHHYKTKRPLVSREISDLPHPIIGYIGVVQERVDIELIKYVARKNRDKSIVIVGPIWHQEDEDALKELPNIHLLGYKPYELAPSYIQQFDVGLIPHRKSGHVTSTNPMKMYEYLACGKPVVATQYAGVDMFADHVYIAHSASAFDIAINRALVEDGAARRRARTKMVEVHSWKAVVGQMLDVVEKKLHY